MGFPGTSTGKNIHLHRTQVSHIVGRFFIIWATREGQEYWSGQPIPSPGDLPYPGIKLGSPALQVDSLPAELPGKLCICLLLNKWQVSIPTENNFQRKNFSIINIEIFLLSLFLLFTVYEHQDGETVSFLGKYPVGYLIQYGWKNTSVEWAFLPTHISVKWKKNTKIKSNG